jgi:diguanylate cyclase (GGDEF)-like protein
MRTPADPTDPGPRRTRASASRAILKDTAILLAVALLAILAAGVLDPLRQVAAWSVRHEDWYLDEIVTLLVAMSFGLAAFGLRRVRELRREMSRRRQQESKLAEVTQAGAQWFWQIDRDLRFRIVADDASEAVQGLVRLVGDGVPWDANGGLVEDEETWARHRADLARRKPFQGFRFRLTGPGGEVRHLEISGQPVPGGKGKFPGYRGSGRDVTREVIAEREARRLALHDWLTGLPNRRLLRERLDHATALARRGGQPAALLCLDLYRFRELNDTLGPTAGDQLLKLCAARLAASVGAADVVARLGDDEFAILQSGGADPAARAEALCCTVLSKLAEPFDLGGGQEVTLTASIGVALAPGDGARADDLLKHADVALARAQAEGPCSFCFFEPDAATQLLGRKTMEHDLWRGFRESEFELYYLPKIEPASRKVIGLEALIRWNHPERGVLEAGEFMPAAESSGLILPLGEWALRTACARTVGWPEVRVAVNLSRAQFLQRDLVGLVRAVLQESGLEAARLELEIPDEALLPDPQTVCLVLDQLQELGVQLILDDVGARYAGLAHLRGAALAKVKLDRSVVTGLLRHANARALIGAIAGVGQALGLATAAEGVETGEQRTVLAEAGCVELQGYYFSRPLRADEIDHLLEPGNEQPITTWSAA